MPLLARVAAGLIAATGFAFADNLNVPHSPMTGSWLYRSYVAYRDGSDAAQRLAYISYVSGVVDMLIIAQRTGMRSPMICPPLGLPMRDYLETVGRHLEADTENLNQHRASYVLKALQAQFACGKMGGEYLR